MRWFKFYGQDWLTDTKVIRMSAVDKLLFITLLCLADETGTVKDCDEETLKSLTHLKENPYEDRSEWNDATGFLQRMTDNGMITLSETGTDVIICNWVKRQGQADSGYERVKRWREKQKLENKPFKNDNADNGHDNARIEENRIDNTSADKPREVEDSSYLEENTRAKRSPKYPHAKSVFKTLWGDLYPKSWERITTQLVSAENLYERGIVQARGAIKLYNENKEDKFCPSIRTPHDLDTKWEKLLEYKKRNSL